MEKFGGLTHQISLDFVGHSQISLEFMNILKKSRTLLNFTHGST